MRASHLTLSDFPDRRTLADREGGSIYLAQKDDKFYVITDESAFASPLSDEASLLSEEDLEGLILQKIYGFENVDALLLVSPSLCDGRTQRLA